MNDATTFELAVLGTVISLASMFSVWVMTDRSMGAWGTTIAAAVIVMCALHEHTRSDHSVTVEH